MSPREHAVRRWARPLVKGVVLVSIVAALTLYLVATAAAASSGVRIVEKSERYSFSPASETVALGSKVTWTNGTDAPHTITSDTGSVLDSGRVAKGQTFSMTFSSAGTFAYHCTIHPYMKGTIVVLAAGATPPATDAAPAPAGQSSPGSLTWLVIVGAAATTAASFIFVRARRRES